MSSLAPALLDSLSRLLPAPGAAAGAAAGIGPVANAALLQVITALTAALERGDLAVDLEGPPPEGSAPDAEEADAADWPSAHLAALQARGWLVEAHALVADPQANAEAPVVRDGRWLRWRRWHQQLNQCREALIRLGQSPLAGAADASAAAAAAAAAGLDPQQCAAVVALLSHRLVLLSGGPGTGKTSTVVQMLAAALRQQPELRLHLAAPTGKAAARLGSAVASGAASLEPALAQPLQTLPCSTLHRLLEARGDGFRRGRQRPLALDLLVVDEVSMVDLPLMEALLAALPPGARLLLVGDPGQLAPVGPGAVLLELCRPDALQALGPAAVELRTTYRNDGAIAALADQLRNATAQGPSLLAELRPLLQTLTADSNLHWRQAQASRPPADALQHLRQHQQRLARLAAAASPAAVDGSLDPAAAAALLTELEALILLSPIRQGPWGVEGVHGALLGPAAAGPPQGWPLGTPVLNRRNLPEQGLANGDIGVLVERCAAGSSAAERLVLFPGGRLLHPARLGPAEPALALTVHKAQGSQYGEVLLLLPASRRLDARLLYTGLTRARRQAHLVTPLPMDDPDGRAR